MNIELIKQVSNRRAIGLIAIGSMALAIGLAVGADDPSGEGWRLACRLASYGKYQSAAWDHLPTLGVHRLFLNVPEPGEVDAVRKQLEAHHLEPLVIRGHADLGKETYLDELAGQLAICEQLGVRYMFLSPKHAGASKEVACERLRKAGDLARKHGVVIALETHPDLGTNAEAHLDTMRRVNHPNVRVNFDTGNITYYNEGADVVSELEKVADYVATVELKDHGGRPKTWDFPALGKGKIDFRGVLRVLREHHYAGPITIEVEGVEGKPWDEDETKQAIAESVTFLRSLGMFR